MICAVSSSTRFETKLNSDHDKFCLECSLSNFSKALLDNNTFAIEALFFLSKMLSNTNRKTSNLSQYISSDTFKSEGDNSQSVDYAVNSGTRWFTHTGLFLINLDFTEKTARFFNQITNIPATQTKRSL